MKSILLIGHLLFLGLILVSCQKEKDPEIIDETLSFELTVVDQNNTVVPFVTVYIFDTAPTSTNINEAITSRNTDEKGVISLSLDKLNDINLDATLYFTVVERTLNLEYTVLGTLDVNLPEERPLTISEELQIADRTLQYPFGAMPTTIDSKLARDEYDRWKNTEVLVCNDGLRVRAIPAGETKVEAIGFGTMLSAYADDQETFDGLMRFYDSKRTDQANNMMAWDVTCDGIADPGSATDGDIDVAFANIVAHAQWGGDYLNKAREILDLVKDNLIVDCTVDGANVRVLAPGYSNGLWGGCGLTDIQYYTPAFFRVFAKATGDEIWNELADDTYVILNAAAHSTTGLVPDWHTASGTPGPSGRVGYYGYDACRVPWRLSLDYLWNGNTEAEEWCVKISDWVYDVGAANIVDGYELDGTPNGANGVNSAFLGGFSVAMMANDFSKVNNFSNELSGLNDTYWFNLNTRVVYLFALTGNFWEPEI